MTKKQINETQVELRLKQEEIDMLHEQIRQKEFTMRQMDVQKGKLQAQIAVLKSRTKNKGLQIVDLELLTNIQKYLIKSSVKK